MCKKRKAALNHTISQTTQNSPTAQLMSITENKIADIRQVKKRRPVITM